MVSKTGKKLGANKMLPLQENPKVLQLMVMMVTVMVMMESDMIFVTSITSSASVKLLAT